MSDHPTSASPKKRKRQKQAGGGEGSSGGGGRVKVYLHAVTNARAALLANTGSKQPLKEVKKKSGADIQFDTSPVSLSMKILIIRGVPSQIEKAVKLISEMTGVEEIISTQAEKFWLQWVKAAFPDLHSRTYFLPPVFVNRVPATRQSIAGQNVQVFQSVHTTEYPLNQTTTVSTYDPQVSIPQPVSIHNSDLRDDAALQRVLFCLQEMSEQYEEVMVGLSQLLFGQYLGESCYAAAAAHLPIPTNLPSEMPRDWTQGDFDILLIHRHYGFVLCELKSFGDIIKELNMTQQDIDSNIRKKLKQAVLQLNKGKIMLSHLVSDIAPGLRVTTTIAVPNLTAHQMQQAISADPQLIKDLCRYLETTDPADIAGLCLCCDQLSDPKTPWDVSSHVLKELGHWWQRRVAGAGPDSQMTANLYETLVARFCGPATTVTVPCTSPPRVSVKTLGQAVSFTGECYSAQITLFPEQVHLLHAAPPRLFVTGPPGTGKTVVLLLMGIEWLRCGKDVYVVCTGDWSRAACTMMYRLLLRTTKEQQTAIVPSQPSLLLYDLTKKKNAVKAAKFLSKEAKGGSLYVIMDEAGPEKKYFKLFCDKLRRKIPGLHLWSGSCYAEHAPASWQIESLTKPLRSPPAVLKEVMKSWEITDYHRVQAYSERGVPDYTEGPRIKRVYHRADDHTGLWPDCVTCGQEVADFLYCLGVGFPGGILSTTATYTGSTSTPPYLQWRDILVLYRSNHGDNTGIMTGLREAGIPVRVMKDDDIEDVATARSNVVWAADGDRVRGLERKVVVCLGRYVTSNSEVSTARIHFMSRCTSQLVIVSPYYY